MLKVWRGRVLFAECTNCGSFGTAPGLQSSWKMTPEIAEATERNAAHMMELRASFERAARAIAQKIERAELSRAEGTQQIRELWNNHVAQVQLAVAKLPNPDGKAAEFVASCPWCGVTEEVEVEALPPDVAEPPFSLLEVPVPVSVKQKKGE